MTDYVIIVAGGKGLRMGTDIPKQFLPISGKPVLMRTLERFREYSANLNIILVLPKAQQAYWQGLCKEYNFKVEYLLAEAKSKGWNVEGEVEDHFEAGIWASMTLLNDHYLGAGNRIGDEEIAAYVEGLVSTDTLKQNARAAINTQAWILHLMNPAEAWANMRRSDYPVMMDRSKLEKFEKDFTYDDKDLSTPVRLRYPILEGKYNSVNYQAAIDRMGGSDDWHKRLWWDKSDIKVK